ncbi:hypothetical protein COY23_04175 [bacterium (Candidatus Torokbacteria) CG_4_10_14_0_2_um_filter_35_8]|nr:MAG: hypothetical protein COY23_04175 [bacterium (Candidatus Torokbacteria) CG_4_10_14_0_2_um_filter_35_8]
MVFVRRRQLKTHFLQFTAVFLVLCCPTAGFAFNGAEDTQNPADLLNKVSGILGLVFLVGIIVSLFNYLISTEIPEKNLYFSSAMTFLIVFIVLIIAKIFLDLWLAGTFGELGGTGDMGF